MFSAIAAFLAKGAGAAAAGGAGAIAGNAVAGNAGAGASGGILDKVGNFIKDKIDTIKDPEKFANSLTQNPSSGKVQPAQIVPIEGYRHADDAGALLSQLASMNNQ